MAEEKTQFHQGWLYAREDGLQFAPYTVTEGIYNQDGTLAKNGNTQEYVAIKAVKDAATGMVSLVVMQ